MGRRLERHVDWDLVEQIEINGKVHKPRKFKTVKEPRKAATYRGARRNEAKRIAYEIKRRGKAGGGNQENYEGPEGAV